MTSKKIDPVTAALAAEEAAAAAVETAKQRHELGDPSDAPALAATLEIALASHRAAVRVRLAAEREAAGAERTARIQELQRLLGEADEAAARAALVEVASDVAAHRRAIETAVSRGLAALERQRAAHPAAGALAAELDVPGPDGAPLPPVMLRVACLAAHRAVGTSRDVGAYLTAPPQGAAEWRALLASLLDAGAMSPPHGAEIPDEQIAAELLAGTWPATYRRLLDAHRVRTAELTEAKRREEAAWDALSPGEKAAANAKARAEGEAAARARADGEAHRRWLGLPSSFGAGVGPERAL